MTEAALLNDKNKRRPATTSESVRQGKTVVNTQKGQTTRRVVCIKFLRRKYLWIAVEEKFPGEEKFLCEKDMSKAVLCVTEYILREAKVNRFLSE